MAKVVLSTTLLVLISVASSSPITSRDSGWCPDAWVAFGSSCYNLITEKHTWSESQAICKTKNSSLVQIESQKEDEFVVTLALKTGESVWIGLNDLKEEGNFVWADTQRVQTYSHWAPGEPNDYQQGEDCASSMKINVCGMMTTVRKNFLQSARSIISGKIDQQRFLEQAEKNNTPGNRSQRYKSEVN